MPRSRAASGPSRAAVRANQASSSSAELRAQGATDQRERALRRELEGEHGEVVEVRIAGEARRDLERAERDHRVAPGGMTRIAAQEVRGDRERDPGVSGRGSEARQEVGDRGGAGVEDVEGADRGGGGQIDRAVGERRDQGDRAVARQQADEILEDAGRAGARRQQADDPPLERRARGRGAELRVPGARDRVVVEVDADDPLGERGEAWAEQAVVAGARVADDAGGAEVVDRGGDERDGRQPGAQASLGHGARPERLDAPGEEPRFDRVALGIAAEMALVDLEVPALAPLLAREAHHQPAEPWRVARRG